MNLTIVSGRIVKDAVNKEFEKSNVTNFTVAHNESFKNAAGEKESKTTYFDCSFWNSKNLVTHLKTGVSVLVHGEISASAYNAKESGEAKAALNLKVNYFEFQDSNAAKSEE